MTVVKPKLEDSSGMCTYNKVLGAACSCPSLINRTFGIKSELSNVTFKMDHLNKTFSCSVTFQPFHLEFKLSSIRCDNNHSVACTTIAC